MSKLDTIKQYLYGTLHNTDSTRSYLVTYDDQTGLFDAYGVMVGTDKPSWFSLGSIEEVIKVMQEDGIDI